ncbi:ATP-grasp domain-containing protein [Streptomyces sp. OF3]|uniref:ATP-grasp domain-containing protein n=1 Tax=Streptomyces alkaliterrae TaxID=2213162 RepID=A0A7W3WJX1_9ACTN|nr:ATP-grasp domain-containing protein [Streptomyces alkaliterrae]MBB1253726.1 ATP-grasp domain-containing protein [Streptomyces alkaliterrae]MBB1257986.1 ATP-grasp domain-containing protein [Streptomyces alkaliterrae]
MFRIAVVGGRPAPVKGARELGIDVVLVHEEGNYDPAIGEHCERIVHAPITDGPAILAALRPLHEERPFDRVITTTEFAAESTGHVVDALGLPGVTEATARALKDKALTRELLDKHGLSPVRYRTVRSAGEAAEFLAEVGERVVLKPADGVASLHIHLVETAEQAAKAWDLLAAAEVRSVIAEEYLEGPVVSVDSFSHDGRHVPIGYSEYRMNDRFVEWEVSTPSRVAVPHLDELRDLTVRFLDAVGLTEGPSHSEFVLTPKGPRVLESHARLAGSGAPELVRRAFGCDLNRWFLTVPLGIDTLPDRSPDPIGGAAVRFFTPEPGKVDSIDVDDDLDVELRRQPVGEVPQVFLPHLDDFADHPVAAFIAKNPGEEVPPLLTVMDCVSGYVIASGTDADDAVARCEAVNSRIHFRTN